MKLSLSFCLEYLLLCVWLVLHYYFICFSLSLAGNYLFFGCRSKSADFFFEKEWLPLAREGALTLRAAFSRDQDEKEYVQHLIQRYGEEVWQWVGPGKAHFFIAG